MAYPQCISHERTFAVGDKKCFLVGEKAQSSKLNGADLHEIFRPLMRENSTILYTFMSQKSLETEDDPR